MINAVETLEDAIYALDVTLINYMTARAKMEIHGDLESQFHLRQLMNEVADAVSKARDKQTKENAV